MVNKPKQKGTKFETACKNEFQKLPGFESNRIALMGKADRGDVEIRCPQDKIVVVECKCHKSYTRKNINEWRQQALNEAISYAKGDLGQRCKPVLIVSQYGKSLKDSYVHVYKGSTHCPKWEQMYFDEFLLWLQYTYKVD